MNKIILALVVFISTQSFARVPPQYERINEINACVESYLAKWTNYNMENVPVHEIMVLKDGRIQIIYTGMVCSFIIKTESLPGMSGASKITAEIEDCGVVRADYPVAPYSKVRALMEKAASKGRVVKYVRAHAQKIVELKYQN